MKKVFSVLIAFVFLTTFSITAQAKKKHVNEEDYLSHYSEYKDYYTNVYVPSYETYNKALSDLAVEISNTEFESVEQAQRVINFLNDLKARKVDFFGNRETIGKSRYVVPTLRTSMYDAAAAENYESAYTYCSDLIEAVEARVDFLNGLKNEVNLFEILLPNNENDASVSFTILTSCDWWYTYELVITNNSDHAIEDWTLLLAVDGDIDHANLFDIGYNGFGKLTTAGGYINRFESGVFTLSPQNRWQGGYIIPAGGTLTFVGGGESINGIVSATIDGAPADFTFSK